MNAAGTGLPDVIERRATDVSLPELLVSLSNEGQPILA
jgi:hypothetical protein